jgi:hypothetical protein
MSPSVTMLEDQEALAPGASKAPPPTRDTSWGNQVALVSLAILVIYAIARNVCQARVRPLWYDEICTLLMAQLEHTSRLWQAVVHGADGQPISFYLLERAIAHFVQGENLAYRGISIVAFAATLVCLFAAVRTRKGPAAAALAAAVPLATILFEMLAVEARPYSLIVALVSFAVVCYQRAEHRRWVALFGVSLILAEMFHYFAVFAFLPFFCAEAAYYGKTRQLRKPVWLALFAGLVPLVLSLPILSATQKIFGLHFWAKPTLEAALGSYSWYFMFAEASSGLYIAAVATLAVLFTMLQTLRQTSRVDIRETGVPVQELVLVLGFLTLPFIGFAAASISHGGMTAKYMVPSVLGFALALGFCLPKLRRWNSLPVAVATAALLLVLVPREQYFWGNYTGQFVSPVNLVEEFVTRAGHPELPVVLSDTHDFMIMQHYADRSWRQRCVILLDPEKAVAYYGSDTGDRQLALLRQYTDLPAYDAQPFLAAHPQFLLYSSGGGLGRDWWPVRFKKEGFQMVNVYVRPKEMHDYFHRVVLVTHPKE